MQKRRDNTHVCRPSSFACYEGKCLTFPGRPALFAWSIAAWEEGVSHDLRGLTSCEGVGRPEVWSVLVVARLSRSTARIPAHYSRPVDEQPLYEQVEGASNRYVCEGECAWFRVREA